MTTLKRTLYSIAAVAALIIGLLGLLIPVIPGILFLLIAAVLVAGVSTRMRNQLHSSRRVRPYLLRWEASNELPVFARLKLAGLLLYAATMDSLRR